MPLPPQRRQLDVVSGGAWLEVWLIGCGALIVRSLWSQSDALIPKPSLSLAAFPAASAKRAGIGAPQGPLQPISLEAGQQVGGAEARA